MGIILGTLALVGAGTILKTGKDKANEAIQTAEDFKVFTEVRKAQANNPNFHTANYEDIKK